MYGYLSKTKQSLAQTLMAIYTLKSNILVYFSRLNYLLVLSPFKSLYFHFCETALNSYRFIHAAIQRYAACRKVVSYGRRIRVFFGVKLLSVCAGYRPGESLWVHSNGVSGKSTFNRRSNLSWLSKICNHFGEIDSGSQKSLTKITHLLRFWGKNHPLRANFHKCFPKRHMRTRKHVFLCKLREIWPTGSR